MRSKALAPIAALFMMVSGVVTAAAEPTARPVDLPVNLPVNPRTSFAVVSVVPGVSTATPNADEPRPALSIIKLYLVDFALRHGDGSPGDKALAQSAIQLSDNNAANALDNKYPQAIGATAGEFHLTHTWRAGFWGNSTTSARDTASFLSAKEITDPGSPILGWMATAAPVAADGTAQNWGTAHIPAMMGTKWGWADDRVSLVASASFGPGFATAAFTNGGPGDENADLAAFSLH
ncbi:MAG: hypothetical protein J2P18_06750 [Nocardia sp.]|nr:hypothetical protein [Nocardia sp.]